MSGEKENRRPLSARKRLVFSLVPVLALVAVGEIVARLVLSSPRREPFFYVPVGHEEYFGTSKEFVPYRVRPPYHWVPVPGTRLTNNEGFRGPDWTETRPPGVLRIASIGDSCTMGGQEPYSERLERLLSEALGPGRYEVLNAGVGSSSTHQMLQVFEQHVLPMKPDWVIVFPGWNDRWVHDGRRDSSHRLPDPRARELRLWLGKSSLLRALMASAASLGAGPVEPRVPPEETAGNLRAFVELCRERNLRLVLTTTPDGTTERITLSRFDERKPRDDWDLQLYGLWKEKADGPLAVWRLIHETYNDVVRAVARSGKVPLVDLDRLVPERRRLYAEPPHYFFKDGIHLTELGLQEVARLLALGLVADDEKARVSDYLESAGYFAANARRFAAQHQPADAELFAVEAEKRGLERTRDWSELRARIAADRPFYDLFNAARIQLSGRGDPDEVLRAYQRCLELRPDDQGVRLELADLARSRGRFALSLQTAVGRDVRYTPQNALRALSIGAQAARGLGREDLVEHLEAEIARRLREEAPADAR